jgi:hypothetical protein
MPLLEAEGEGETKQQAAWAAERNLRILANKKKVEINEKPNLIRWKVGDTFYAKARSEIIGRIRK